MSHLDEMGTKPGTMGEFSRECALLKKCHCSDSPIPHPNDLVLLPSTLFYLTSANASYNSPRNNEDQEAESIFMLLSDVQRYDA